MGEQRRLAPTKAILFVEEAPEFTENANIFRATFESGGQVFAAACSPHTLLVAIERARRAYDAWDADNQRAQGIRGRKR